MLKLYFLMAFRSLVRHKSYSLLNIAGLALGITCSILLFLVIRYQLSYDTFHGKADRIYRLNVNFDDVDFKTPGSHFPLVPLMRSNSNLGFEEVTQVYSENGSQINIVDDGGKSSRKFREEGAVGFVEPAYFNVFDFETNMADPGSFLMEPNAVMLTQSIADKYFPGENAVGRILRLNDLFNLKVTAVIPDIPANSEFPFIMLISYETIRNSIPTAWNTLISSHQTYVVLPEGASASAAAAALNSFVKRHTAGTKAQHYIMQRLDDIHYNPDYQGAYAQTPITKETILAIALIGVVLLLTACINFINLATAQAIKRAKEVGVRKVLGSNQVQLMLQFLGETLLIVLLATLLSVIFAELALPYLNELLELKITFHVLEDPVLLSFLVAQTLLVTLFAGLYPALVLSSFQPLTALKSRINLQQAGGVSLRQVLVVLQFTICQVLIICTILVNQQMDFFRNKPLGFKKDAVLVVNLPSQAASRMQPLRQELLKSPIIRDVSFASAPPTSNMQRQSNFYFNGSSEDEPFDADTKYTDAHYYELYDVKFLAGSKYDDSDSAKYMVINDTMRRKLGIESPGDAIGKKIAIGGAGDFVGPIVGVVADFHQTSLRQPVAPMIMASRPADYGTLSAKIDLARKQEAIRHLEKVWHKVYPNDVFNYDFLDDSIAEFYEEEARQATLFKVFSLIAIFIGCLGLYGLIAFMAAQRTKEVGIRKVMGASVLSIAILFSKEFIKLVLIAFVLAAPIAYYLISLWLQDYTYRISISYWPFILAGVATMFIALLTMSAKAIQAALANPVLSLKSE